MLVTMNEIYEIKSSVKSIEESGFQRRVSTAFESEEVITDTEINLFSFSKYLNLSPKVVSQNLNREFEMGFKELLNKYRVKYAIRKIEDGFLDLYTIEALAEVSGFNSRVTFFNAFKKETSVSPTDYWKRFVSGEEFEE